MAFLSRGGVMLGGMPMGGVLTAEARAKSVQSVREKRDFVNAQIEEQRQSYEQQGVKFTKAEQKRLRTRLNKEYSEAKKAEKKANKPPRAPRAPREPRAKSVRAVGDYKRIAKKYKDSPLGVEWHERSANVRDRLFGLDEHVTKSGKTIAKNANLKRQLTTAEWQELQAWLDSKGAGFDWTAVGQAIARLAPLVL